MPNVKKPYSYAEAKAAIDRSNGQRLSTGAGDPHLRRPYNATGRQLGHEYMHRGAVSTYDNQMDHPVLKTVFVPGGGNVMDPSIHLTTLEANMLGKSRMENRETSYRLTEHLLNSAPVQQELDNADNNVGDVQKWLRRVPVTADLYGYEAGSDVPKKITEAAINFRKIGDHLFVASVYPVSFAGERDFELDQLFK